MSGIVGHVMYALLGAKIAAERGLPVTGVIARHLPSYLCGAYLGSDVQTLPQAICLDTGQEVGYGGVPLQRSPITGGAVKEWTLAHDGAQYTPRDVHRLFYGRAHLIFGFGPAERHLAISWEQLPAYCGAAATDCVAWLGPGERGERALAYLLGWATHVVGDSLIKSFQPGLSLFLLNGQYTPQNRPIQDLVTFHQVGRRELRLDWQRLMASLAETPVEEIQLHYMRVSRPRGALASAFPDGWLPDQAPLLRAVLAKNRRYLRVLAQRWLAELALRPSAGGWECDEGLRAAAGGLPYAQMVALAEQAGFRLALQQIGEAVADLLAAIVRHGSLHRLAGDVVEWEAIAGPWRTTGLTATICGDASRLTPGPGSAESEDF
jgi:hypothetical protein